MNTNSPTTSSFHHPSDVSYKEGGMIPELVSPFSPLTCPPPLPSLSPPLLPLYVNRSPETRLSLSPLSDKGEGEKAAREISPNFPSLRLLWISKSVNCAVTLCHCRILFRLCVCTSSLPWGWYAGCDVKNRKWHSRDETPAILLCGSGRKEGRKLLGR